MTSIPFVELQNSTAPVTASTKTTCPYCGVGCGVIAHVKHTAQGQVVSVEGDASHPSNYGKLCIKGSNLYLVTKIH